MSNICNNAENTFVSIAQVEECIRRARQDALIDANNGESARYCIYNLIIELEISLHHEISR